ncbi:protein kinase domain-containing protein [Streptacidiphilus jiangxiensis]|uniref:non-specific serine/threonine protein kinase n=1 Tax=Streptacidiphilus jiangxiensis TaxID=235985 RepID=A0A1H7PMJ6_STRJI|nr:protein kinase [Streptacidiphilus jiangxiensis]SEL37030.1 serine/threonine protein kinase [Streptacidiphilus jiangxiensis]
MQGGLLNGRYELHDALGTGGMATVWRGLDRVLGRPVAVKVMNPALAQDPRFAERFAREARHAAMLLHPAIVAVFDSGTDENGTPYLVMELVDGRTLAELLADTPRLPVDRAVAITAAVCEALQVAHAAGLVHRDIKPGNIMVAHTGEVKVVDFGIAKAGADDAQLTGTGSVLGTASYLAPEQATAAAVDGRADLYALGCVLTEMLTGRPPFDGTTPVEIAWKQVSDRPAPPSALRPDLPPALDAAVLRLLAKEPGHRPADAATARAELLAAIGHGGPATTGVPAGLTGAAGFATPAGGADMAGGAGAAATTWLPPMPRAPLNQTMAMPPLDGSVPAPVAPLGAPRRRRTALLAAGVGVALVCVVAAVAYGSGPSGPSTPAAGAGAPSATVTSQPGSGAATSTTPSPQSTDPASTLAALRSAVDSADLPSGQQQDLLDALDSATQALSDQGQSNQGRDDAAQSVRDAQKILRKLGHQQAVDPATLHSWQSQLNTVAAALRDGSGGGDGNGNNG